MNRIFFPVTTAPLEPAPEDAAEPAEDDSTPAGSVWGSGRVSGPGPAGAGWAGGRDRRVPDRAPMRDVRFACTCGRFIPETAIRYEDYRDPGAYYGVGTRVEWDCSRCGTVQGAGSWEPPLVVVATRVIGGSDYRG